MTHTPENHDTNSPVWEAVQNVRLATGTKLDHLSDDAAELRLRDVALGFHLGAPALARDALAGLALTDSETEGVIRTAVRTYPDIIIDPRTAVSFKVGDE